MQKLSAEFEEAIVKRAASEERQWCVAAPAIFRAASRHLAPTLALSTSTNTHSSFLFDSKSRRVERIDGNPVASPIMLRRHVGVYSILCQDHIVPNDIDIIDAFGGSFPDPKLAEPGQDARMAAVRSSIVRAGCEVMCTGEGSSKRKKKKTNTPKKKGKKGKHSKKGKE